MFDDIYLFINLVESGGFHKAAKNLGIHQSTISRRIELLEAKLKIKLIKTIAYGRLELTEEGINLFNSTRAKFEEITSSLELINLHNSNLYGNFSIVIPALIYIIIGPAINEFLKVYPDINFHISNYNSDLNNYELAFDVALSFIKPSNPNFIISVLYSVPNALYASTQYIEKHGMPTTLQDLRNHQVVVPVINNIPHTNWQALNSKTKEMETVTINNPKASYDGGVGGKFLVLAHQGISAVPDMVVKKELLTNKITRVLENYSLPPLNLYMIKSDNNFNAKTITFIEFLKNAMPVIITKYESWAMA